jgi:hypothetical protein
MSTASWAPAGGLVLAAAGVGGLGGRRPRGRAGLVDVLKRRGPVAPLRGRDAPRTSQVMVVWHLGSKTWGHYFTTLELSVLEA